MISPRHVGGAVSALATGQRRDPIAADKCNVASYDRSVAGTSFDVRTYLLAHESVVPLSAGCKTDEALEARTRSPKFAWRARHLAPALLGALRGEAWTCPCALYSRARLEPSVSAAKMFAMNAMREISDPQILWSGPEDRALKLPEAQLLDAIASGDLDDHLVAIADAVHARRELLHTVRSATAIAQLCIGETVMFNGNVRPRYLEHELAVITELDEHWVTLRLARPVGRYRDGELRCPPLAVRKLEPAGS